MEEKTKNRETEIQQYYDYAVKQSILCENEIEYWEIKLKETKDLLEKIKNRALEQNCLHIL